MELSTRYNAKDVEEKWYQHWLDKNYFHSEPDERESFSVVIPPPNVTGVLHMGHMLNNTIQDILVRKARLDGKNACWVPGTDHASIATEAKVVRMLREQGIKKSDLTREKFLDYAWEWKEKYGGIILQQLKKLGASCDWERTAFTMDETRSEGVIRVFVDLYNNGKLYRGLRMVNWDPEAQTVLSNEEVLYGDEDSRIFHVRYQIEGTDDEWITVATTRPETILGDTAIAAHPDDQRYESYKGKNAIVPLLGRAIPIIFDDYVDKEFGTGALKITPAHDPNDYEIGLKHKLEVIDILNDNGTLSEKAQLYIGEDRFAARKLIVKDLEAKGNLVKIENYRHSVGRSERTNAIVEPKLSLQWYVDMKKLVDPALEAVMKDEVEFFPKKMKNTYKHWMENIRDWCISRQLWWGQRVPAYYYEDKVFVAETSELALAQAKKELGDQIKMEDLRQDEDVLDTWFSSWLWPITVFDGFNSEDELNYYYPTSVLVTGWDIIFLWVARMIMAGYEWKNLRPFDHVYFTGMVRDKQRRKMSKSLGNSPDALELIEDYGADGVRFGMLSCSPAGGDLLFEEKHPEQGRNFCNKMWNALRLLKGWEVSQELEQTEENTLAGNWFRNKFNKTIAESESNFKEYRLSEALIQIYSFIWNDFCSSYLEMIKPQTGNPIDAKTKAEAMQFMEELMVLLHPFMPFITEEIYHQVKEREEGDDCMVQLKNKGGQYDTSLLAIVERAQDIVKKVREQRNAKGIKMKDPLNLFVEKGDEADSLFAQKGLIDMMKKSAFLESLEIGETANSSISFVSGTIKLTLEINQTIDVELERERITKELEYQKGFVNSVKKKLDNERFVNNAPAAVVDNEKGKLKDGLERIKMLEENLGAL